ncbi:MAG: nuclease/transposase family protein [Acidimicrobiales bacterium]
MGRYKTTGTRKRKRKRGAPTHIANVSLDPTPTELSLSLTRNRAGLRLYNAVLKEAKKRSRATKADPEWEKAYKMEKGKAGSPERVRRSKAFEAVREANGFTRASLLSYGSSLRKSFIREQVFSQEAQELAARAFDATWMWHLGRRGEPHFKKVRDGLHSLSCKDLNGSMRPIVEGGKITALQWGRSTHIAVSKAKTREEEVERARIEALVSQDKLLYCRVVNEQVRGRTLLYLQLVLDGPAPLRHQVGKGKVSFDLGPSSVHVVAEHAPGFHEVLAPSVKDKAKELRRALRHLDRQHRAGSPECFDPQGRHIKGRCYWKNRSKAAEATKKKIKDTYRVLAKGRDRDHGNLANRLYELGDDLRCEGLNYVSWQKNWPHSVRYRAPGAFVERVRERGKAVGKPLYEYDPHLALSQTCIGGERVKKPLSMRRHVCVEHDLDLDRDLFSAFLGLYVEPVGDKDILNLVGARTALLERASAIAPQRQDLGVRPERAPVCDREKPRVHRRCPPGRRSLVRIHKRLASKRSDRVDGGDGNAIADSATIPAPAPAGGSLTALEVA